MGDANQLELNKGDNFIFLADVSRSMGTKDCPGGMSRIDYLKEGLTTFVNEASKYDDDGIDLITFGVEVNVKAKLTPASAAAIIAGLQANEGATDTASAIEKAWSLHKQGGYEQTVVFVATDGEPSDKQRVKEVIRDIASKCKPDAVDPKDSHEFAISFLTVGKRDAALEAFLVELDDDLKAKYDIVDVKEFDKVNFMQAFDGALHD